MNLKCFLSFAQEIMKSSLLTKYKYFFKLFGICSLVYTKVLLVLLTLLTSNCVPFLRSDREYSAL